MHMPRYPRKTLPAGFAVREYPDGTYQAYRLVGASQESPRYTRRIQAVNWCWLLVGHDTQKKEADAHASEGLVSPAVMGQSDRGRQQRH